MLSEKVHPIKWLEPDLGFYELARKKRRFPSRKAQFCTMELKMIPTQQHLLRLRMGGNTILAHSGVRKAEGGRSDHPMDRSNKLERDWDGYLACDVYRPLLHWTIGDVWAILKRHNIPPNPLYGYGAKRVGCFPCINSNKAEIRSIARNFPERIDMIREAERAVGAGRSGADFSSFFSKNVVPPRFRSKTVTNEHGLPTTIATVDDVVRWSLTGKGAVGSADDEDEPSETCAAASGMCE